MNGSLKEELINKILEVEGGYVDDPNDSGGETNFGITVKTARQYGYGGEMKYLTRYTAFCIYVSLYWDTVRGDELAQLSSAVTREVVDTGVNLGVSRAGTFLQRAINVLNNGGRQYADVVVDGQIGPATLRALGEYLAHRGSEGERVLVTALNCLQGAFYIELAEKREKDERFVYGWLNHRVVDQLRGNNYEYLV